MNNLLALRAILMQRLESSLNGRARVVHASELQDAARGTLATPCVAVIYDQSRVTERTGRRITWQQTWHVVVVVRNVTDPRSGAAVIDEAGELMHEAISALDGLSVPRFGTLQITESRGHAIQAGLGFFPITLQTTFTRDPTCQTSN